jgi:hypothetical protein
MNSHILSTRVICKEPGRYIAWPSIAKTPAGELLVVFSGDRDGHVCPYGKGQLIRSRDEGQSWSEPATIVDTPLDDRDMGLAALRDGTLALHFSNWYTDPEEYRSWISEPVRRRWQNDIEQITPVERARWIGPVVMDYGENRRGHWIVRSGDGGYTWEEPVRCAASSPHGPIELADGCLLQVGNNGYERIRRTTRVVAEISADGGRTWSVRGTIPMFPDAEGYLGEPHVVEAAPGRLVAMLRYEKHPYREGGAWGYLWQADSPDGGASWTAPRPTSIWGKPPHLLRLADGQLLVAYGHRRAPFGQRACLSRDGGKTWDTDREIVLTADAPNDDLGYPASVELADGSILTVYYQVERAGEKPCIMATHWRAG